jgi:hypothetical protein
LTAFLNSPARGSHWPGFFFAKIARSRAPAILVSHFENWELVGL